MGASNTSGTALLNLIFVATTWANLPVCKFPMKSFGSRAIGYMSGFRCEEVSKV